jgi:hypothetical protein
MRRNFFGDAYCHTIGEVLDELSEEDTEASAVYLADVNGPEGSETMWCGDVSDNDTGDTVLYIEAPSRDEVIAIAKACGIEDQS